MTEEEKASICQIIVNTIQTGNATSSIEGIDPVMLLPQGLRSKLIHRAAFRRAFDKGFLCVENGTVVSQFGSPWALAYFTGRCFSNDKSRKMLKSRVWEKGNRPYPATELDAFFRTRNLRVIRKYHLNNEILEWFEEIDNLFVIR